MHVYKYIVLYTPHLLSLTGVHTGTFHKFISIIYAYTLEKLAYALPQQLAYNDYCSIQSHIERSNGKNKN